MSRRGRETRTVARERGADTRRFVPAWSKSCRSLLRACTVILTQTHTFQVCRTSSSSQSAWKTSWHRVSDMRCRGVYSASDKGMSAVESGRFCTMSVYESILMALLRPCSCERTFLLVCTADAAQSPTTWTLAEGSTRGTALDTLPAPRTLQARCSPARAPSKPSARVILQTRNRPMHSMHTSKVDISAL